jgi:hypothetical protein
MSVTIYTKAGELRAVIEPDEQSAQSCGIMRDDTVTLNISVAAPIAFQIGDYATIFNNRYQLNQEVKFKKVSTKNYEYILVMEGYMYDLGKTAFLFLDAGNHFTEGQFTFRGRPIDFINVIIYNMNRIYPGQWQVGNVVDADYHTLTFNSQNCLEVLSNLAQTFLTEYLIIGQTIHLYQRQLDSGITLEYGPGKALFSISRDNQSTNGQGDVITRLYAYGSNRNIGSNYRFGAKFLRMADSLFIEKNTDLYGVFEKTIFFDGSSQTPEIYPRRTGTVSAVTSPFIFTDASIDFDVNAQLMPGVTAKLTFNTGQLAGYSFTINAFNYGTKTFTINKNTDEQTIDVPSALLSPAIGDNYVLTDILMPLSYVDDAEAELLVNAQKYLAENSPAKVVFSVECNPFYFKANGVQLQLGYIYGLLAAELGVDRQIRATAFTRNIRNPILYTVELADKVTVQPLIVKLLNKF